MPVQKTPSVLAKYGDRLTQAVRKSRDNPVDYGFQGRLPPGITRGIAQVEECGFFVVEAGKQNAGEVYYRQSAVVIEPSQVFHGGRMVPVRGMTTSTIEMICDTKSADGKVTTMQEHVDNIVNSMKMLGGEDCIPENPDGPTLEHVAGLIKGAKPFTWFSTSQGKVQLDTAPGPNKGKPKLDPKTGKPYEPRVWENWHGSKGLEEYVPPEPGAAGNEVVDSTVHKNGQQTSAATQEAASPPDVPAQPDATATLPAGDTDDLDVLAARAQAGDGAAEDRLKEMGRACGFDVDDLDEATGQPNNPPKDPFVAAPSWAAAVALIRSGGPAAASTAPEPTPAPVAALPAAAPEAAAPKKGAKVNYRLRGPDGQPLKDTKTKLAIKPEEYEIVTVNAKDKTVGLKHAATGRFLVSADKKVIPVPWANLE